ncbi:hypothetical protein E1B28_012389 [Marasmius oreades]|uniref:Uncharacterized protein n=1 Tax=Marasmius oreades TaxID=181124 RepID=A0A9P7RRF8_9AGAR|nr:uncharacterized protein E1B28_012389 [Marasmius oreades]KAG7088389.1 hypothetical protein E1B28_012389 [Marasmius oreades]
MAHSSNEMPQATPDFAAQSNVLTAVDSLKSRFMREWSRDPSVEEAVLWNNANKDLICWNCAQLKVECAPATSESLPCTRCIMLKSQQICTRVIEERRARVKRIMNLDEDTFIALKTTCFQSTRPSPHFQTYSSDIVSSPRNGVVIVSPETEISRLSSPNLANYNIRQRSYSTPSIQIDTQPGVPPNVASSPSSSTSLSTTPRRMSTPEVIDLTGDFDTTVFPSQAKPQSSRQQTVSSARNYPAGHSGLSQSCPATSTSHFRQPSYQPGSPFGVFASGHASLPNIRHSVPNSEHSVHSPDRRSSFETELSSASPRYFLPSPPTSAPAAPMVSGFSSTSLLPPPSTAPVMNIPSNSLHSSFTSPADVRTSTLRYEGSTSTKEAIINAVQGEVAKIREVTWMVAQRNQQMRSISEHYERSGILIKQEVPQLGTDFGGGTTSASAGETIARLQDELDTSRHLNQRLMQRNDELRCMQRETDELRHAYRDLLQRNESLQRQQKKDNPVRMMRHLHVSSPDCEVRSRDGVESPSDTVGQGQRSELDFTLSLLNMTKEELNNMMAMGTTLQRTTGLKDIENG